VLRAAVREFRQLCDAGVPDIEPDGPVRDGRAPKRGTRPSAARQGKVAGSGGPSSPGSASPAVPRPAAGDAPEPLVKLEDVVLRLEQERFGRSAAGMQAEMVRVRRRIRTGLVQVAGRAVRDPLVLVDPSEVAL
jgi:hypothetical protein